MKTNIQLIQFPVIDAFKRGSMAKMSGLFKPLHFSAVLFMLATLLQVHAGTAWARAGAFTVITTSGQLRGLPRPNGGVKFLGIPYAQPPVGDLRWREPLPAKPWSGVRDATAFGAPCAQWADAEGDWNWSFAKASQEDCLYLNVITPVWPAKKPLPVMFWIHGGGNEGGTASTPLFNDGTLVDHGVVLVTVNYRLGIFGFFAHPGLTRESPHHVSGNYGLMDQILALRWVIANIAKFGGDPANITVFGQSAGAQDTGLLMTSQAKDLFQKAIAESGTPLLAPMRLLAQAEQIGVAFAADLKAPAGDDAVRFLRRITAQDLMKAIHAQDPQHRQRMAPIIDGWVISRSPAEVFASGQDSAIPLMIGSNSVESGDSVSPDELRKAIQKAEGEFAPQALALYGLANGGQGAADPLYSTVAYQWSTDTRFRCPATTQAAWHSAAHHPTYEYEFQRVSPGLEAKGAGHSAELPYVFGYYPKSGQFAAAADFVDADYKLADQMQTYWTNFAGTGNPNSDGQPHWPGFEEAQAFIVFTPEGRVANAAGLRGPQCNLYREVLAARMKQQP
jgi:para-nitrobenzyl esterase